MPVPSLVTDLSTTVASNSPAGSDNVFPDLDNYIRALSAFLASIRDNSGNGWVSPYLPVTGYAGNVGIGTNDPTGGYGWAGAAHILGIAGDASASTASYGAVALSNNRATPSATDDFGVLAFTSPSSVAGQTLKAFIKGTADGAGGVTGGYGGQLQFYTKADNNAGGAGLRMQLDAAGDVQIGTGTAGLGKLRILDSGSQTIELTSSDTSATNKSAVISVSRYTSTDAPFTLIRGQSSVSTNIVYIGGGATASAPATDIVFYTGALSSVGAIGTEAMRIRSDGAVVIGANADATLNMKAGTTGTTGSINWTFNTDSTVYGSLSLPFDTRATVGLKLESTAGYPITVNAGNGINFQEDGVTTVKIDSAGNVQVVSTGSLGYGIGSGGAVTQITSRTTGVTLNKTNGSITLVSAAGSTAWQSFTVTNSTVGATDVVHICQKSGTDLYEVHVTAVAAGSFRVSFKTTGGTTTEQPVFNFVVISAVTS